MNSFLLLGTRRGGTEADIMASYQGPKNTILSTADEKLELQNTKEMLDNVFNDFPKVKQEYRRPQSATNATIQYSPIESDKDRRFAKIVRLIRPDKDKLFFIDGIYEEENWKPYKSMLAALYAKDVTKNLKRPIDS